MSYKLEIRLRAILDAQNATDYYDAINTDLGNRFRDELYDVYKKITTHPEFYKYLFIKKQKTFRCARFKTFPYMVIYRIKGATVVVTSVFNTYRKPMHGHA